MFIPNTSILYIENFIDQSMVDELNALIRSDYDDFYVKEVASKSVESRTFVFDEKYNHIIQHIYDKSSEALHKYYDTESEFKWQNRINHFYPGKFFPLHVDNMFESEVTHGCVFYINDEYEGGEIYYPELGIEIKPPANSFIMHPVLPDHIHGVKMVTSGDRFTVSYFAFSEI